MAIDTSAVVQVIKQGFDAIPKDKLFEANDEIIKVFVEGMLKPVIDILGMIDTSAVIALVKTQLDAIPKDKLFESNEEILKVLVEGTLNPVVALLPALDTSPIVAAIKIQLDAIAEPILSAVLALVELGTELGAEALDVSDDVIRILVEGMLKPVNDALP